MSPISTGRPCRDRDYFEHFDYNPDVRQHARRALDLLGLRQTASGSCPRRLVRLPHLELECWCTSPLNDHGRRYRAAETGKPTVVWEPYGAEAFDLAPVLAAAHADGLRVHLTAASPWFPGRTIALIFTAKETS